MIQMPTRKLGHSGPIISAIGYDAMGLSAFYGSIASNEERFKVLDRVIELGFTYIDSSDIYGDNEDLIGKYFKKYPHQLQKVSVQRFCYFVCMHKSRLLAVFHVIST